MSWRVIGSDLPALGRWAEKVHDLPQTRQAISHRVSQSIMPALMEEQFEARRGPGQPQFGKEWEPALDDSMPQMERTGDLRRGYKFSARSTPDGIEVSCRNTATRTRPSGTSTYWQYLNRGTETMEARRQFPVFDEGEGLPAEWIRRFVEAYKEVVKRHLREGRL